MGKGSVDNVRRFAFREIEDGIFVGHHHAIDGDMVVYALTSRECVTVHWNTVSVGMNEDDPVLLGDDELAAERNFNPELLGPEENLEKGTQARVPLIDDACESWADGMQENVVVTVEAFIIPSGVVSTGLRCGDKDSTVHIENELFRSVALCGQMEAANEGYGYWDHGDLHYEGGR